MRGFAECRVSEMPGGLPAVWETTLTGATTLYLRADLSDDLVHFFRAMCDIAVNAA